MKADLMKADLMKADLIKADVIKVGWLLLAVPFVGVMLVSCGKDASAHADSKPETAAPEVAVTKVVRRPMGRSLTVSSELVPFQDIDVFAKESGYVKQLLVDYGSHVKAGQLMAVLEIPELEANIQQDESAIKSLADQVTNAEHQLGRVEAQHKVLHLEYDRINSVSQSKPGLVAQQEVDDVQGRDLAAEAQVEGAKSNVEMARSNMASAQSKLQHDKALFDYARITAPFSGVVTQRYANLGTLMQAGTNSSTQAMPLVKLSQEDLYRVVIPVPETYVSSVSLGDAVSVRVPALNQTFPGKVARFASDVHQQTRTMHTEVDVQNPKGTLLPGLYAEVTLTLNKDANALAVPLSAVERESDQASVDVVDSSGKVQIRQVVLGIETANDVEVMSGLQEGDQVVISDRTSLTAGEQVTVHLTAPNDYKAKS
jgi:RND family efflux transporter MFP subunit